MKTTDQEQVRRALTVAYVGLWGKHTLRSLEEFINRATGMREYWLGELEVGSTDSDLLPLILTGILHEVIDENIENFSIISTLNDNFGSEVLDLSQKYCKLPRFMARRTDYTIEQAENQLQMLVVSAEDYRTLYIRLADRLHAMRVLRRLPLDNDDRCKIAQEALYVYAPLAHKMGMSKLKGELEDTALKTLDPEEDTKARYTQIAANKAFHDAINRVQELKENDLILKSNHVKLTVTHRTKGRYELLRKMKRKGLSSPNEVKDVLGMRLILDIPRLKHETYTKYKNRCNNLCYYLRERVRHMPGFEPVEGGFKDYIKFKKKNGYESLHQYVRDTMTKSYVELQIRTKEMHVNAELGACAHWYYKDSIYRSEIANSKTYRLAWRSPEQMNAKSCAEVFGFAKQQILQNRVFVYLDDSSTVLNLPKGATALDAAFSIHTKMGLTAESIEVDNRTVSLDHKLSTGDVVRVTCAPNDTVQATPAWLSMMHSSKSQSALRKYFRSYEKSKLAVTGISVLLATFASNEVAVRSRFNGKWPTASRLAQIAPVRTGSSLIELLIKLGSTTNNVEVAGLLTRLLDGSNSNLRQPLTVISGSKALLYASMQGREDSCGWEDVEMLNSLLLPLVHEILPQNINPSDHFVEVSVLDRKTEEFQQIESVWMKMIGPNSLTAGTSVPQHIDDLQEIIDIQQRKPVLPVPDSVTFMDTVAEDNPVNVNKSRHIQQWMRGLGRTNAIASKRVHSTRSPYSIVEKPFSLEASSLSPKLLLYARRKYALDHSLITKTIQKADDINNFV
eukprot:CAMPEP_0117590430 /NCGR_PEP_ID=MMETSP0784-20121206/70971_1 /TAXON_ID=39447 /ORGANISM="" /LENGTH=790 /DNA_ID=CAMNT_0005392037 /DNA_START=201 /DNA_END=2574 /DNA_ORIENTATION=-